MLKRTLEAPPENGTIAAYTSELSRFLRNGVPGERADQIITEAEAHLHDQADVLVQSENLSRSEAEARAVAAFTPAKLFARDMAHSAYETRQAKAWRRTGRVVGGAAFIFLLHLLKINDFFSEKLLFLFIAAIPITAVCAFQARRAQTRQFLICGTLAALVIFFYTGFNYLDGIPGELDYGRSTQGTRGSIVFSRQSCQRLAEKRESELRQLEVGLQKFQTLQTDIPAQWKGSGGGYIVPASYRAETLPILLGRREVDVLNTIDVNPPYGLFHPFHNSAPETVTTFAEARLRWQTEAPFWLAQLKQIQAVDRRCEQIYQAALLKSEFAKYTATRYAGIIGTFAAFLVVWDIAFATWGRAVYTKRRTNRTKGAKRYA